MKFPTQFLKFILFVTGFIFFALPDYGITLFLKPNAANGKDAVFTDSDPNTNYGTHPEYAGIAWTCNFINCNERGALQFDLSSIPVGAVITSAQLSLFANTSPINGNGTAMQGANQANLLRITSAWNENTITWNNQPTTTTLNQVTLPASFSSFQNYLNIDVKNLVQDMVNNPSTSFGFFIRLTNEVHYASMIFASSDFSNSALWPEITINYTLPIAITSVTPVNFCQGSQIVANYSATTFFNTGNVFTLQLSSSTGSFSSPVNIGSLSSVISGSISGTIPANISFGTGYRVRVVSSNPSYIGDVNGTNLTVINPADADPCTVDACDVATNLPVHTPVNTSDNNVCTTDNCDPSTGNISHIPINTSDNNPCTQDLCDPLTGITHPPVLTSDNNECTADACDPATGIISHTLISFNDNNPCTTDFCDMVAGIFHIPINVSDNNPCTDDACNVATGLITHTVTSVNDNNACTVDGCDPVTGIFHTPISFTDNNPCTIDGCDPLSGIFHTAVNTDDGNACTIDNCDFVSGQISHQTFSISDNNPCTTDACDPQTGNISHTAVNNNDNNACTQDACDPSTGIISHTLINTNDNNACTFDGCDFLTGVFHLATNTNDGNPCTTDACDPVTGIVNHVLVNFDDNNMCTTDGCDYVTGVYHTIINVNDNNACTQDACDPVSGQISHTTINTNDNDACTFDGCDFVTGVFHLSTNTNDGNPCTEDACDPVTGIVTHILINFDDNNQCTNDGCDLNTGIYHSVVNVNDNNACTQDACDPATGIVSHNLINTNDNNACSFDGCDFQTGVFHIFTYIDDGNVCTTDACDPLTGVVSHSQINSDDNNACTLDGCDVVTGVFHNTIPTDDGNPCTNDACDIVTGNITHTLIDVDDSNACTIDACDPLTGNVIHTNVIADDNNVCTIDGCDPITGIYNTPIDSSDDDLCTIDGCDPVFGVFHIIINNNDNNACTIDNCDPLTGVYHTMYNVNDSNECTIDGCDPLTGIFHRPVDIDDKNNCTIDACDPITGIISHTDDSPNIIIASTSGILCYGETTCLDVNAVGGLPPYYGTGHLCGFAAGTHIITIIDSRFCEVHSPPLLLTEPSKLNFHINVLNDSCGSGSGGAFVNNLSGGTPPYNFEWKNGSNNIVGTSSTIGSLLPGNYSFKITDANGCNSSTYFTVFPIGIPPSAPFAINGLSGVCANQTFVYSFIPPPGASSFVWTLPPGVTGSSNGSSITVTISTTFTNGYICVRAVNGCGSSSNTCKLISRVKDKPAKTGPINGPSPVCQNTVNVYCTNTVANASSYVWAVTGNGGTHPLSIISGQGSPCVIVNIPPGYTGGQKLKVYATNCKGAGASTERAIGLLSIPNTPGSISGSSSVCKTQLKNYSISNVNGAMSYSWSATQGAIIAAGQGTNSVTVDFNLCNSSTVVLTVVASNACGTSGIQSKNISVNLACKVINSTTDEINTSGLSIEVFPNPAHEKLNVNILSGVKTKHTLKITDLIGKIVYQNSMDEDSFAKEIDVASLTKGLYLLRIEDAIGDLKVVRIVVE